MKRKGCPILVQSDTYPSYTMAGESHTRTYLLECVGEKCAAYQDGWCQRFETPVELKEEKENA